MLVTPASFIINLTKGNTRLFGLFSVTLLLIIIASLRFEVGTDYNNYLRLFQLILSGEASSTEPALEYIVKGLDYLKLDFQFVFVIYSTITILGYMLFLRFFSSNLGFSIFLYFTLAIFYFAHLNLIRQFAAVAIFLFSIRYILNKKLFKYIVCIVFASCFHFSAIVMLPVYYILTRNLGMKIYLLGFAVMYVSMNAIELLAGMTKYGVYIDRVFENSANVYLSFLLCFINSFFIIFQKNFIVRSENKEKFHTIMNMNYLSLLLVSASLYSHLPEIIFLRYNYFFVPALLVLIPAFIGSIKIKYLQSIAVVCLIIFGSSYYFLTIEVNGAKHHLVPYKTILSR